MVFRLFIPVCVALLALPCRLEESKEELLILAMAPFSDSRYEDPGWDGGPALIPAARLAVDQINHRLDTLKGYSLKLLEAASGCELIDKTRINFVEAEFYKSEGRGVVGMVGPGCSESALATAHYINRSTLNIVQVSIASVLEINGDDYQNSFRTIPSASVYVDAFLHLVDSAGWNRLAVFYDNQRITYSSVFCAFKERIAGKMIYSREMASSHLDDVFKEIDNQNIRIIFVFSGLREVQKILCFFYSRRSSYIDVQFVFMDLVRADILKNGHNLHYRKFNCTLEDMEQALNNVIFVTNQFQRMDMESSNTLAGISYNNYEGLYYSYLDRYLTERNIHKSDVPAIAFHYFNAYYDAVWALAIALNDSMTRYNFTDYGFNRQKNLEIGNDIRTSLNMVSFEGMSGLISFNNNSRDISSLGVVLNQTVRGDAGTWDYRTGHFFNDTLDFVGVYLPDTLDSVTHAIHAGIGITVLVVGVLSIICQIVLQATFSFLNMKEVKASSPQLNFLNLSGCCLYLAALFIYTIKEVFSSFLSCNPVAYGVSCNLLLWCFSLAFSLIFGTICAKTWRIYRIFNHFKQGHVKYVSDELLVGSIVCLLLIDVGFLTAWNLINPWVIDSRTERSNMVLITYHRCSCDNMMYWLATLIGQKVILMVFAVVLSILVRPVKKKGFKNTKAILILIYSLAFIHLSGMSIYSLLDRLNILPVLSFLSYSFTFVLSMIAITLNLFFAHVWPSLKRKISVNFPVTVKAQQATTNKKSVSWKSTS